MDHAGDLRRLLSDPKTVIRKLGYDAGSRANRSGVDIKCPSHDDDDPSCSVFRGEDGTVGVNCHACGFKGDVLDLVAKKEGLDAKRDFPRVLEAAAEIAGYDLKRSPTKRHAPKPAQPPKPTVDAEAIWNALGTVDDAALAYLNSRGIGDAAPILRVATAQSPGKAGELASKGYVLAQALRSVAGRVVAIQLRSLDDRDKPYMSIGPTSEGVFGNPLVVDQVQAVIICEGFTDYLAAHASIESGDVAVLGIAGVSATKMIETLKVRGKRVVVAADADEAGDKCADRLALVFAGNGATVHRARPTLGKDLCEHKIKGGIVPELIRDSKVVAKPQPLPFARSAADIHIKPVRWIWRGRIPAGMIVMLDGDPGLGKSTLLAEIGARITRGDALQGDGARSKPAGVIFVSFEDSDEYTIAPRLIAAGADMKRVRIWRHEEYGFSLPDSLGDLELLINECEAAIVVVDPFVAALEASTNSHKDQDVRKVMAQVKALCDRTGVSAIFVRHLNKNSDGKALYRGGGAIGIIGAARVGLVMDKDPDDEDARVLAVTKCNVGRGAPSLRFRLVEAPAPAPGIDVARVQWDGVSAATADDLLANQDEQTATQEAMDIIKSLLADGPVLVAEVQKAYRSANVSDPTANRAKRRLKVKSYRVDPSDPKSPWLWKLPT